MVTQTTHIYNLLSIRLLLILCIVYSLLTCQLTKIPHKFGVLLLQDVSVCELSSCAWMNFIPFLQPSPLHFSTFVLEGVRDMPFATYKPCKQSCCCIMHSTGCSLSCFHWTSVKRRRCQIEER